MANSDRSIRNSADISGSKENIGYKIQNYRSEAECESFVGATDEQTVKRIKEGICKNTKSTT